MSDLADKVLRGDVLATARLIRDLDDGIDGAIAELKVLYPQTGKAEVIGVTGAPGVGKSTLVSRMIENFRARGKKVGVIAVDPTSPFSGGAVLGDRIRMQNHFNDPGVFIRSMATRGHLGGLSSSAYEIIKVLDAFGSEVILVETVGVGQDEVEIAGAAQTTVVVLTPGMGDEIQNLKAGILEIADVLVVNKADREGAQVTVQGLRRLLEMGGFDRKGWHPPICLTVGTDGTGIPDLIKAVDQHREFWNRQKAQPGFEHKRREEDFLRILQGQAVNKLIVSLRRNGCLEEIVARITRGESDPYSESEKVLKLGDYARNE
ncbi:MAG: methylmalonyl Co-A mutase-associated GTPase MeaB [Proteobacteria bacterium]|nr:methylmalonyl Co-A mutase-associated GTPase MeaB [Pseudomonadota bacterium]